MDRIAEDDLFAPYLKGSPEVTELLGEEIRDGVRIMRFRFASFEGSFDNCDIKVNEIYAVLARPVSLEQTPLPGLLVCHGGGQQANEQLAIEWAKQGFIVLSPDLPGWMGEQDIRSFTRFRGVSYGTNRFTVTPSPASCAVFDSVVAGLRAFNLLAAQPDVDSTLLCITGISWGGYLTVMLCGLLGSRVHTAFSLFGCGFYEEGSVFAATLSQMPSHEREQWRMHFDAGTRISRVRANLLIYAATNDAYFYPPAVMATFERVNGLKYICFSPNDNHCFSLPGGTGEGPICTSMEPAYFRYMLGANHPPLPEIKAVEARGMDVKNPAFRADTCPPSATPWAFYTVDLDLPWEQRSWHSVDVHADTDGSFVCNVPQPIAAYAWFGGISFTLLDRGMDVPISLSTTIEYL